MKRIVQEGYDRAYSLLEANREALVRLAEALLEYETLDSWEIEAIINGQPLSETRQASTIRR